MKTRTATLIETLDLSQPEMARWLRTTQPTVSRMASGQPEPGPVSRLLDHLESVLADAGRDAARALVLSGALVAAAPEPFNITRHQAGFQGDAS